MSDSPIFDQLVSEFAKAGAVYDEFVRFTTPAFEWEPMHIVQLDKQPKRGISITKHVRQNSHCSCGIVWPCTIGADAEAAQLMRDNKPAAIEVWKPQPEAATPFTLLQDYVDQVSKSFVEAHPGAVITNVSIKPTDFEDNTISLVVEGLHPTVKPLSERNTAQPME